MERSKRSEDRRELLNRLIRYQLPIEPVLEGLADFRFDSAGELVCLQRSDLVGVLDRFLAGELSADQVRDWADQLEVRDDVGVEPGFEGRLRDALFSLANPNLAEPLTPEMAERVRAELGPSDLRSAGSP